jgi:hypothetical protein
MLALPAFTQTAALTGVITDANGGAIESAAVNARNIATGIRIEALTNYEGYYTIPRLDPGEYELTVRKSGFRMATRPAFKLDVGQVARVDMSLTVGDIQQTVTVLAEAPIVTSEMATVQQVVGAEKIVDLPLNGRDFTQLATLTPGAVSRGLQSSEQSSQMSINGMRNSKTEFMLDGASVSNQYFDVPSILPSVDAIQEFSVQSNSLAAEYGKGTSIINVVLKSGTNQVHGAVFEFFRN